MHRFPLRRGGWLGVSRDSTIRNKCDCKGDEQSENVNHAEPLQIVFETSEKYPGSQQQPDAEKPNAGDIDQWNQEGISQFLGV